MRTCPAGHVLVVANELLAFRVGDVTKKTNQPIDSFAYSPVRHTRQLLF